MNKEIPFGATTINSSTLIFVAIIILGTIVSYWYIYYCKKKKLLISKRRWIEQLPSLISTLGVLGTFWGITVGLLDFETGNIDNSIPELLDGLKTAFFTSLAGMIGSLILSRLVSSVFDEEDGGVSDINMAAGEIVSAVREMSEINIKTLSELKAQSEQQVKNQEAFYQVATDALLSLKDSSASLTENISGLVLQAQAQTASITEINGLVSNITHSLGNIEDNDAKQTNIIKETSSKLSEIHSFVGEIATSSDAISSANEEISRNVQQFGQFIHGEVLDIEDKMSETNKLLNAKFDEFTDLLKKSNTEALVEVMKQVTVEFQKQMNALINKLIQENFEQLNQSVERLNVWQQENKEMISSLTSQYQQMANNFEETSTTLNKVGSDTRLLVSDGGKLQQLISSLNKVIVEDEHFIEISANLSQTATLSKTNMEAFEESTKALNEWVKKQRNFVDGVTLLIEKLDELNKIRDYNEAFWKDTKQKMEEGVGYLTTGSQTLNAQLTNLDKQFYARLSATLAELDSCISAMIKKHN